MHIYRRFCSKTHSIGLWTVMKKQLLPAALASILALSLACSVSKSSNPLTPTVAGPIPGVGISAPSPMGPDDGAKIAVEQQPVTLVVQNATTTGVRPLSILIEIAVDSGFTNKVFTRDDITPAA